MVLVYSLPNSCDCAAVHKTQGNVTIGFFSYKVSNMNFTNPFFSLLLKIYFVIFVISCPN